VATAPTTERRRHVRHPVAAGTRFHHDASRRDFPARCANASAGGALMYVPAGAPLRTGHSIRLHTPRFDQADLATVSERDVDAEVVRVERDTLLSEGQVAVGVRFAPGQ